MRSALFGLLPSRWGPAEWVFDAAAESAGYTHGHPTGKLASGALAAIVRHLCEGADLDIALDATHSLLSRHPDHEETSTALSAARDLAASDAEPGVESVEKLGGGWIAEEALAIAV